MLKMISAGLSAVLSAGVLTLVMTAPAHADPSDCERYLDARGYTVGKQVKQACRWGYAGDAVWQRACINKLDSLGVYRKHAYAACKSAALPQGRRVVRGGDSSSSHRAQRWAPGTLDPTRHGDTPIHLRCDVLGCGVGLGVDVDRVPGAAAAGQALEVVPCSARICPQWAGRQSHQNSHAPARSSPAAWSSRACAARSSGQKA